MTAAVDSDGDGDGDDRTGAVAGSDVAGEADWERRRRLAEVFGDALPETTSDERDPGTAAGRGEGEAEPASEAWLKAQVPPHHG